jgi:biopolymer transport protein ExbD
MNRRNFTACIVLVLGLLFAVSVSPAKEKQLKKSDLPPAVQATADEQSKGATVLGYASEVEEGKLQYEVQLKVNGHSRDVTIAPNGGVLEVEEQVELNELPAEVREGLKNKADTGTIGKIESITKHGSLVAYEAHVSKGNKKWEVQVGPAGKPLAHPE